ncbi:MAG: hypothetical protein K2X86_00820 [Cytophagaceae bacterium]|nr:hypothetical protein [Cytophagaceae bacterium]
MKKKSKLPLIESIRYVSFSSFFEKIYSENRFIKNGDSLLKIFNYYDKKLPNIGNYEVYHIRIDCQTKTDSIYKNLCQGLTFSLGYAILYNPSTKQAYLILVEYNFLMDTETYNMWFTHDTNRIILEEEAMMEGQVNEQGNITSEDVKIGKHFIEISKEGEININSKK